MTVDFVACEPQFIDHVAPVWHATPAEVRGRFLTEEHLLERARGRGIDAEPVPADRIRAGVPPKAVHDPCGPQAFVCSIGDTKVARRLGYRRFAFMEHGAGQTYLIQGGIRHPSYAGGADREDTELFLVPNEYAAASWRASYPAARVDVVGCPKLDDLPSREATQGPVVAISFHWPAFVAPEAGTALGHYVPALADLAARFRVIGHAHPKGDWPARIEHYYRAAGIELVRDFDEVCRRADVYVCDNSSTLFEFASTGRPVVVLNAPQFRRNVRHGGRFWDWAPIGINVDQPTELGDAIERALEDREPVRRERERVLGLVYAHTTGAAARAAVQLSRWAGVMAEVA
jgi:hypothetical protein